MVTKLGIIAGEILNFLSKKEGGKVESSLLLNALDHPAVEIWMSLGWLAREGHVILEVVDGNYTVKTK